MSDAPKLPEDYLGDGVYARLDPSGQIELYTLEGMQIFLEPEVLSNLDDFRQHVTAWIVAHRAMQALTGGLGGD